MPWLGQAGQIGYGRSSPITLASDWQGEGDVVAPKTQVEVERDEVVFQAQLIRLQGVLNA